MTPDVVADIGNSRIKWARCLPSGLGDVVGWTHDAKSWEPLDRSARWAVAGVVPRVIESLVAWVRGRGSEATVIDSVQQIPLQIAVGEPQTVGVDRLLGAVSASRRWPGCNLLVIDAGTAITLNHVDASGTFRGGAILPGLGLMARSLHQHTAKLPLVEPSAGAGFPAGDTRSAIQAGIALAGVGAVMQAARAVAAERLIFTGGDGELLYRLVDWPRKDLVPELNLEGIRIAAESLK